MPGGLLTDGIVENFPGFSKGIDSTELMVEMQQQAERFGAKIQFGSTVEAIDFSGQPLKLTVDGKEVETQTVIIASGAGHRHLGLESEAKLEKKGSPTAPPAMALCRCFATSSSLVVGGGDSACEEAMSRPGSASKVYLVHRRDELRGVQDHGRADVGQRQNRAGLAFGGHRGDGRRTGKGDSVKVRNNQTNEQSTIDCAGLFIAIGHIPRLRNFLRAS